jgi:Protein of unknown function (DUF3303)
MKYMIEYDIRREGLTHDQLKENQDSLLKAFGKWSPETGLTIDAFLSNLNYGGYVLVQADDPRVVYSFVSKFVYWNDVNVVPVVDVGDGVTISTESLAWARSVQ